MQMTPEQIIADLRRQLESKDSRITYWQDSYKRVDADRIIAAKQRDEINAKCLQMQGDLKREKFRGDSNYDAWNKAVEDRRIVSKSRDEVQVENRNLKAEISRLNRCITNLDTNFNTNLDIYNTLVDTNNDNCLWILAMEFGAKMVMDKKHYNRWVKASTDAHENPPSDFNLETPEGDYDNDCPF